MVATTPPRYRRLATAYLPRLSLPMLLALGGCAATQHIRLDPLPPVEERQRDGRRAPALPPLAPAAQALPEAIPQSVPMPSTEPAPPAAPLAVPAPPTTEPQALVRGWADQQRQLYQIAAPLLMQNTALCPQFSRKILGFTAKTQYSYSNDFVGAAHDALGLDERLQVTNVLPGGGAARAGIEAGDILLAVADTPLPQGPDAERLASNIIGNAVQGRNSLEVTTLRGAERTIVSIVLTPVCAMVVDLGNSTAVNSYADGRRVMVTRGMFDFITSDTELAYVLAREIASNLVVTGARPELTATIDRLHTLNVQADTGDQASLPAPTTAAQDARIERTAMYLLARAGYELEGVRGFWEHLYAVYPADVPGSHAALHSPLAERLTVIDRTRASIEDQRRRGVALMP